MTERAAGRGTAASSEGPSLVVVNAHASQISEGGRRSALVREIVAAMVQRDGRPPAVVEVREPEETTRAVLAAVADGAATVVAVGGDGTVRVVAALLAGTVSTLGIVGAGTGNLLAGTLGIPSRTHAAARALTRAVPRRIDLGEASWALVRGPDEGRAAGTEHGRGAFVVGAGVGFDALVMLGTPAPHKRTLGRSAYFLHGLRLGVRPTVSPYRIIVDGSVHEMEATIALGVNCAELIPGVLRPRLRVDPSDGQLDVLAVRAPTAIHGLWGGLELLGRVELGRSPSGAAWRVRGREVRIESIPAGPLQVDGDPLGFGSLDLSVRPGALAVLVPPETLRPG